MQFLVALTCWVIIAKFAPGLFGFLWWGMIAVGAFFLYAWLFGGDNHKEEPAPLPRPRRSAWRR